jgi:hypothetical protein
MPIITTFVIGGLPCSIHGAVKPSASSVRLACHSWPMISAGRQVAVEALLAGRAERAVERASGLRGDAQRAAVVLRNVDRLPPRCRCRRRAATCACRRRPWCRG